MKPVFALTGLLLLIAAPALADSNFRDAKDGFELAYPSTWEVRHPTDPKIVFAAGTTAEGSQITCDARVAASSRETREQLGEREFKAAFPLPQLEARFPKDTRFDSETYTTFDGLPVLNVEATSVNRSGIRVHIAQRWLYWKRNFITLNCATPATTYGTFRPDIVRYFDSFRRF